MPFMCLAPLPTNPVLTLWIVLDIHRHWRGSRASCARHHFQHAKVVRAVVAALCRSSCHFTSNYQLMRSAIIVISASRRRRLLQGVAVVQNGGMEEWMFLAQQHSLTGCRIDGWMAAGSRAASGGHARLVDDVGVVSGSPRRAGLRIRASEAG